MTVLPSSRIGWVRLPASVGKLRIVTPTSRQTGLERGFSPGLFSEFWEGAPGLPGLFGSGEFLIVSVMAFRSWTAARKRDHMYHENEGIFVPEMELWL
jgi:hypothetical protein